MDLNRSIRPRNGQLKPASAGRLLAVPPHRQPHDTSGSSSTTYDDEELFEDDVLWTDDAQVVSNDRHVNSRSSPTSSASTSHHVPQKLLAIRSPDRFGILGVLPEHQTPSSVFNHKAAVGSGTSSSRSIPNPPKKRSCYSPSSSTAPRGRYHQSMPVNVPVLPAAMIKRHHRYYDHDEGEESDDDRPMLPPHEMVVRSMAQSEMLAFSVLEGAGRTLKGRDLRQVRNAVFQRTGFLD